ncbi:hypothetical protein SADUNF_Sadunf11G0065000 [Salix dunnii]|uniref:Uncharacterized protein n=1 Tax=Salix dunnii TaxID=1413687 RepID=A0A835MQE8_9ROSI|nr:hypothetical protein SADUNF_Sadunf11G0065000 [Salix dunnii]
MVSSLVAKRAAVIRLQQRVFAMCPESEDLKAAVAKAMVTRAVFVSESEIEEDEGACCCVERVTKVKDPYGKDM